MIKATDLPALKQRFRTLIRDDLGLARFKENDDGDFRFHYERMPLKLIFEEDDAAFVWIAHFAFHWFRADDPAELARVDRCLNEVNHRCKAVKLVRDTEPDKDGDYPVSASVSFLAEDAASQTSWALERYLSQIKTGCNLFCELMARHESSTAIQVDASSARH